MHAKVVPFMNNMSQKVAHNAPPPPPPVGSSIVGSSSSPASFLDVILNGACCASESNDNSNNNNINNNTSKSTAARAVGDLGGNFTEEDGADGAVGRRHSRHDRRQQRQQHQHQQQSLRPPLARRQTAGNQPQHQHRNSQMDESYDSNQLSKLPESIILPHLRFQPLPTSISTTTTTPSPSALKDFFDLFLADDAPHSFELFHESNGDEDVRTTPWKIVTTTYSENPLDENTSPANFNYDHEHYDNNDQHNLLPLGIGNNSEQNGRMERTITFQTNITPGSSSNPLSQSDHTTHNNNATSNTTTIPLKVIIVQSLLQLHKRWILECEFSFDFHSTKSSYSTDGNIGVGKKLGTGLGQYLMGNVVKGSTVNVAVTLNERDDYENGFPFGNNDNGRRNYHCNNGPRPPRLPRNKRGSSSSSSSSSSPMLDNDNSGSCCIKNASSMPDGFLSCLSHPLILPPAGLCAGDGTCGVDATTARAYHRGSPKVNEGVLIRSRSGNCSKGGGLRKTDSLRNSNSMRTFSSPSKHHHAPANAVGASLLSAIRAKNAPGEEEEQTTFGGSEIAASSAWLETVTSWSSSSSSRETAAHKSKENRKQRMQQEQNDVLCYSSSGGSLKTKRISSFDLERAPSSASATAIGRILLEKGDASTPGGNGGHSPLTIPSTPGSLLDSSSFEMTQPSYCAALPPSVGLSLRIEMELNCSNDNDNNNQQNCLNHRTPSSTSSLSTSFARSTSITSTMISSASIDEKIRRGLKKRVARSWIAWAESWCMRLWEEEGVELRSSRSCRIGGIDGSRNAARRRATNVRPGVRQINTVVKEKKEQEEEAPKWNRLQVDSNDCVDKSVWMSLDCENECGVEVACTITSSPSVESSSKDRNTDLCKYAKNESKRDGKKRSSIKRRLSILKRG